ncbi:MAG TPA: hypothetical protein VK483_07725 [Chitinophagaceae bacterium]|nr:hypothetical protein [Chitinophagaceae bacterium]
MLLRWIVVFLIIAAIAAIFGLVGTAAGIVAKVLFFIFVVWFLLSFIFGKRPTSNL